MTNSSSALLPSEQEESTVPLRRVRTISASADRSTLRVLSPHLRARRAHQSILTLYPELVDWRFGIIRSVREIPTDEDDPNFFHYSSETGDTSQFTRLRNFGYNGGVSTVREVAVAKAMGEAVERYCSAIFDYRELTYCSFNELDALAVNPSDFALHSPEQYAEPGFPWKPFTPSSPVAWTPGIQLATGVQKLVPAAMVFAPYHYVSNLPDTPICQPISTGLACGHSFESASLSALCEVIERDAFTLTWQARLSCPLISTESLPPLAKEMLSRFARIGIEVVLVDITKDIQLPTVMTIALSRASTSPALAFAASTDTTPELAIVKSIEELAHTRKYAKLVMNCMPSITVDVPNGHPEVIDQRTHLRFYCGQDSIQYAKFAWSSRKSRSVTEIPRLRSENHQGRLAELVEMLTARGLDPIVCDLTTPDIRELGLCVVRAVIPGMHPLFMGYRNRALGGHRLYSVPQTLSTNEPVDGFSDNTFPHPFP